MICCSDKWQYGGFSPRFLLYLGADVKQFCWLVGLCYPTLVPNQENGDGVLIYLAGCMAGLLGTRRPNFRPIVTRLWLQ